MTIWVALLSWPWGGCYHGGRVPTGECPRCPSPVVPPPPPPKFALSQFSDIVLNHFDFNTFRRSRDPIALLKHVRQRQSSTRTATAIWKVL